MRPESLLLRLLLRWRSRRGRVRRLAQRFRPRSPLRRLPMVGGFRAAAVQLAFELLDEAGFVQKVGAKVAAAVAEGAELIVFPEDTGTMLLGLVPGLDRLVGSGTLEEALAAVGDVRVADVLTLAGPAVRRVYEETFRTLAIENGVYIAAGSAMLPTADDRVLNVGYLFGPRGLVGTQAKCHLLPLEFEWGLSTADDLAVWETSVGRLAMPVCMDATYFETFRILELKGADVVLLPTADPEPEYNAFKALRGIWPRVQEARVYGVKAAMVGRAFGLTFTGVSGIYAPFELTPSGDGIVAEAPSATEEALVVADLDLERLRRLRREDPLPYRPEVYRRYFPSIYNGHWRGGEG